MPREKCFRGFFVACSETGLFEQQDMTMRFSSDPCRNDLCCTPLVACDSLLKMSSAYQGAMTADPLLMRCFYRLTSLNVLNQDRNQFLLEEATHHQFCEEKFTV